LPARLALPNLLVYIDLREGNPTGPSLFAVSQARRVARHAGASVFAVLLTEPLTPEALAPVTRRLGLAGADKVLLGEAPGFGAPPLDATHGPALQAIAERIAPLIVLFPAGGGGAELGATLAMRLNGAFAGCSDLVLADDEAAMPDGTGRVVLRRWRGTHSGCRQLDPVEIERPVVATLGATGRPSQTGDGDVEVEIVACEPPAQTALVELQSEPDEFAALELAPALVLVSDEVTPEVAQQLAAAVPPEVAVVDQRRISAAALACAAPAVLIMIGSRAEWTFGSPATRVGLVAPTATPVATTAVGAVDVLWNAGPVAPWSDLASALGTLGGPGSDQAPS
jgi:electron transfer flavoprotein alpha subunit